MAQVDTTQIAPLNYRNELSGENFNSFILQNQTKI
jgi:hypothetical protein